MSVMKQRATQSHPTSRKRSYRPFFSEKEHQPFFTQNQSRDHAFFQRSVNSISPFWNPNIPFYPWPKGSNPLKKAKYRGSNKGENFNTAVNIPGPLPLKGDMTAKLNLHLQFLDTTMDNIKEYAKDNKDDYKDYEKEIKRRKNSDPSSLSWNDAAKQKFKQDYRASVTNVWDSAASKLVYRLNQTGYEKYQLAQIVKLVFADKEKDAHHTIRIIKMLPKMSRLRSNIGEKSMFDSRDASEEEKQQTYQTYLAEQAAPFDTGKSDINTAVGADLANFVSRAKAIIKAHAKDKSTPDWHIFIRGRSSTSGGTSLNDKLGKARAKSAEGHLKPQFSGITFILANDGEKHSGASKNYQRVELVLLDKNVRELSQNTAAHETGHLIGLGDEYKDVGKGSLRKHTGDEAADTSQAIRDAGMGEAQVREHRINQHNDSIMNAGSRVLKGHYAFFLIELKKIATDAKTNAELDWKVEKQ